MEETLATALISHLGAPGVMIALFLWLYVRKDNELSAEREARIEDAREVRDLIMKVQERTNETINRVVEIRDEILRTKGAERR